MLHRSDGHQTPAGKIGGYEMNNRIDRRAFLTGMGTSALLGAWAASARAEPFNIDTIERWLRLNGGYSRRPIPRDQATGSVSHRPTPTRASISNSSNPCRLRRPMSRKQPPQAAASAPAAGKPDRLPDRAHPRHKIKPQFRRQLVRYNGPEQPGTIVVDTRQRFLYLVRGNGEALRFGVGVGRDGFRWQGEAYVAARHAGRAGPHRQRWSPAIRKPHRGPTACQAARTTRSVPARSISMT
jgi:lipoprotein-anchoring transpeptidase ErfK/SrfK